jgi:hypothetical protein
MRNVFRGIECGRRKTVTSDLVIARDLKSGLFGMSLGVGIRQASSRRCWRGAKSCDRACSILWRT